MMREGGNTYYALKEIRLEFGATEDTEQETHREVQLLQQVRLGVVAVEDGGDEEEDGQMRV